MHQSNFLENMIQFNNKTKPKKKLDKEKKWNVFDRLGAIYEGGQFTHNTFRSGIFPIKVTKGKGSKYVSFASFGRSWRS